ncbi:four-carbon acid sugar kinase family protein [Cryobacterium sp. SO2]|uniref:four-carbon acid sugar kinase family protein n=1 Tax=Cryobacterium sp. SO2 TaxID=1897060 RepID=UPI00223E56D3|nr:four-carbon acid sugar kinase family protein [Cryobacterium sp. SO2]WEO77592.1 four-carbon acid sugar kinase family protein [Cryobacterium sp. SO2]
MKTIVLDDDPTGTQSASDVVVLLTSNADLIGQALTEADSVYVLTNSRAIPEEEAVALMRAIRADARTAGARLGEDIQIVLRGDSTLRGHVFSETLVFAEADSVVLFVPAFPDGGRTTENGVHYVTQAGQRVPAHLTEFADDPVFPFDTAVLVDYVRQKSGRDAVSVPLELVRADAVHEVLLTAAAGSVVVPDAVTNDDIRRIARGVEAARARGANIVVRSASPLAAALAGVESDGLLPSPLLAVPVPTLLVCGSHTQGATAQLDLVAAGHGPAVVIPTADALRDPAGTGSTVARTAAAELAGRGVSVVTTERARSAAHNTLEHGRLVMEALTSTVRALLPAVEVVVSKGGITSADVARVGLGATRAVVLGQVLPGVSVWRLVASDGRERLHVVVPGNVGEPDALVKVLAALRH